MTNKIMTILMVVFAVVLYTMAVVDFMLGKPLDAVCNVLFACTDLAVAYMLIRLERQRKALVAFLKLHFDFVHQLEKGVPATLTISKGDDDEDEEEIPEDELTEDEKRIKRMAEEYDQLTGRLERLTTFRDTDTYKQMPENSRIFGVNTPSKTACWNIYTKEVIECYQPTDAEIEDLMRKMRELNK